jgi:protein PsiE
MKLEQADELNDQIHSRVDAVGRLLVDGFHYIGLFVIGACIVWAALHAFLGIFIKGHITISDILLLFIYLELGAMVGIYFKTNHMPVRFLIYVAITALTRLLIDHVQAHHIPSMGIVIVSGGILMLAVATLVIRYASFHYPSAKESERK